MTAFLPVRHGHVTRIATSPGTAEQVHVFDQREIWAVDAAIACRRALLVRGEPGTGKSQLARAVAAELGRPFVPFVVDARTESRDLLWHFDAVARLAEAQVQGALRRAPEDRAQVAEALALANFIQPRPLWWAFDWSGAERQASVAGAPRPAATAGADPANGAVVLIDEIDKAESDVPNGLLEVLGAGEFTPAGMPGPVRATGVPPLVIITTNEERALPAAFLRRCLVLHLWLPRARDRLVEQLVQRGAAHFTGVDPELLRRAAELLADDRARAQRENWLPAPGQAEFMDLVRAVIELAPGDAAAQKARLDEIAGYALRKHPDAGIPADGEAGGSSEPGRPA